MEVKLFEIRDRATCVPAMAVRVSRDDGPIMRRAGFGDPMVVLTMLATAKTEWDPYNWGPSRTMQPAHLHIEANWDKLSSGDVIDVRVLLGETTIAATPECV